MKISNLEKLIIKQDINGEPIEIHYAKVAPLVDAFYKEKNPNCNIIPSEYKAGWELCYLYDNALEDLLNYLSEKDIATFSWGYTSIVILNEDLRKINDFKVATILYGVIPVAEITDAVGMQPDRHYNLLEGDKDIFQDLFGLEYNEPSEWGFIRHTKQDPWKYFGDKDSRQTR